MKREEVIQKILDEKIIAIIRGINPEQAVLSAHALCEGGISLVEVTFNQAKPESFGETADAIRGNK